MKHFSIQLLFLGLAVLCSCTDFKEEEAPVRFAVDMSELSFSSVASTNSIAVTSGTMWDVSSMPAWIRLQSINRSGYSPYEWTIFFSATANDEYNREGIIIIKAGSNTAEISVSQEGRKGKYIAVELVSLSPTELTLTEGENATLAFAISPSNASIKDVTWESSATSIATVSQSGRIDAVSEGTSLITVTTEDGNKTASCAVTVKAKVIPVTGVSLNKTSMALLIGGTEKLTATVSPSNATNKNVTWSSSNSSVATVDSNGNVSAIKVGTAIITVTAEDGGKTATCSVTVNPIAVTSVSLNQTSLSMTVGDTQTLSATVTPSNATDKSVSWSSGNTTVATVSSSGLVTAKAAGTATITVTSNDGGKKATCSVTVKEKVVSVTGVSLNKTSLTLTEGNTETLIATVTPSNATDKSVAWSSSNTAVATVSSSGVVTAKIPGNATITVTTNDGSKTATCSVIVTAKVIAVTGVSLDKASVNLTEGDTYALTATVTPSNASNKSVSWTSSSTSIATVSSSGVVTAKAAGSATITVTTADGGKTATCSVTVQAKTVAVTGISLDKTSLSMTVGDTQTLTATITPSNATDKSVTWSSNNTSVATVSSSGVVTAKSAGNATITVTTNDGAKKATCSVTVKASTISVTGVSLNKTSMSLLISGTEKLTATVTPSNATNKNVTWSSSNTSVATVDSNGNVSGIKVGTAVITVKTEDGGKTATCAVTVNPISVTGVSLNHTSLSMIVGDTQTLTATVTPSNATDKSVTWSSSNTSVATVSSSGVVTTKAAGSATITVTTNDGGKTATCSVTVKEKTVSVTGITLNETSMSLLIGGTEKLTATVTPSNATNKNVTWSSSNTSVATVDSNGNVSGIKVGTAVITVKTEDGGKTATCAVTVNPISVTGVSLNHTSLSMIVGDTQTLTATVTPSNATDKSVTWSSNNTSVATISSSGAVTAKSAGNATITVTTVDGGKTATCSVTVKEKTVYVTGVSLDKTTLSMTEGDTYSLTATITPSNATNKSVTWSSSNTSVATVSSSGMVTAKSAGNATITVTTNDGAKTATCYVSVHDAIPVTGVSLNTSSLNMIEGQTQTLTATVFPSNATNTSLNWLSSDNSVATVSSGIVTAKNYGTATITVKTTDNTVSATCSVTVFRAPTAVDLGLSVKWSSVNITYKNQDRMHYYEGGTRFAWGEITEKKEYRWNTYKWSDSSGSQISKYNTLSNYGQVDNITVLQLEDDAAHAILGGKWRIPTREEFQELIDNCDTEWKSDNGVYGLVFTSRINGNSIVIPEAPYKYGTTVNARDEGYYWTSSLNESKTAYWLEFGYQGTTILQAPKLDTGSRFIGCVIRPVYD